ncbi:MAG TPA: hypothetical protein PKD64_16875 [Pirellulaceae bacterium]|nr:hypothetical protein [Pirellulaceae bacterium]HMO93862.1 hypothetical protein [Pirellulaceae bacterium]HMP71122.1 hypothetical protein [Pirellulaceae bacterium]
MLKQPTQKSRRRRLSSIQKLLSIDGNPLTPIQWSLNAASQQTEFIEGLNELSVLRDDWTSDNLGTADFFERWICGNEENSKNPESLLDTLACMRLAGFQAHELLDRILSKAASQIRSEFADGSIYQDPASCLIRAVEIPVTHALLTYHDATRDDVVTATNRFMHTFVELLIDDKGWLLESCTHNWQAIAASWLRIHLLAESWSLNLYDSSICDIFTLFTRRTLSTLNQNFEQHFSGPAPGSRYSERGARNWPVDFIEHLSHVNDDRLCRALGRRLSKGRKKESALESDCPSSISETCQIALLKENWDPNARTLAVKFGDQSLFVSLSRHRQLLTSHDIPSIIVDGEPAVPTSWDVVCEFVDDDTSFLELQMQMQTSVTLQRHFLLSHKDKFAVIADAITLPDPKRIEYATRFCVSEHFEAIEELENSEIYVRDGTKIHALLLPLALPEWRGQREGSFCVSENRVIELRMSALGTALFSPIWIDLDSDRCLRPRTWRQLTVGEGLNAVSRDVASAFRVQAGTSQWLLYRSLAKPANRSFLGEHHGNELFYGRFKKHKTEEILSVI